MNKHFVSIALVQKTVNGQTSWLLLDQNGHLQFIVGERLERESFRETVIREVAWQLNLNRRRDMLVSNMSQLSVEFEESDSDGLDRHVAIAFYNVHLNKQSAIEIVNSNPSVVWVSAAEICAGQTGKGRTIHPEVVGWINRYEVVRPWQT